jgi:hypothetical protein
MSVEVGQTTLLKALNTGRISPYQSKRWDAPNGKPGGWMTSTGKLVHCRNGVHVCRGPQILGWMAAELYVVEIDGEVLEADDKIVCRRARLVEQLNWNPRVACAFAVDCATRVLPFFENNRPGDDRPRKALEAAITWVEKPAAYAANAAANDAANDANAAYAADAANDAAYAADANAANAAAYAANAAAYAAYAANAAAYAANADAERDWQYTRLCRWLNGELTLP